MKSLKTVQTIYKVLSILVKIGFVFAIIGAAGSLVSGISLTVAPYLREDILKLIISETGMENTRELGIALQAEAIYLVGVAIALGFICKYFKNELTDGTPFTHRGAKELLRAGIINMAVPVGAVLVAAIICAAAGVSELEISNESEMIMGVTMLLLSFVFRYGADLAEGEQTEASHGNE